eukprot:scaffold292803_cov22-Tisochrysis_lutea.AAC.2
MSLPANLLGLHSSKLPVEAAKMESAADQVEAKGPTSFFHGKEEKDYQGGSQFWCQMLGRAEKGLNSVVYVKGSKNG